LRAKFINEKFSNESDPIYDLEVGGIDLEKKWKSITDEFKIQSWQPFNHKIGLPMIPPRQSKELYLQWYKYLKSIFIGRKATGYMHRGNSDNYGGLLYLTTPKKVIRIEIEDLPNFSLVTIQPGIFHSVPGHYINENEVWYKVDIEDNIETKMHTSE